MPSSGSSSTLSNLGVPGIYTVEATCGNTSAELEIEVAPRLYKVVQRGTLDEGPIHLPLGDPAYLKAIPFPEDYPFPEDPVWSIVPLVPDGSNPSLSSDYDEATLSNLMVPGEYVVEAGYYTVDTITVTAVGIEKIVVAGTDEGSPLTVCAEDSVTLEAKPNRDGTPFPQGLPTWSIYHKPTGANASLSNGSGSTTTLTGHDIEGDYIIRATCGNLADFIVKAVRVNEILPDPAASPNGNVYVPVETNVDLIVTIAPADAQFPLNKPTWTIQNYPSEATPSLSNYSGAQTTLSGLTEPGPYEIRVADCGSDASITVIAVQVWLQEDHSSILAYTGDQYDNAPTKGYIAYGLPEGGTFLWTPSTTNTGMLAIDSGQNTNHVNVKGYVYSSTKNDAVVTVKYTLEGCEVQDFDTLTVRIIVSTESYDGILDHHLDYFDVNYYHSLYDQFTDPVNITGIPADEILQIFVGEAGEEGPGNSAHYAGDKNWDGGICVRDRLKYPKSKEDSHVGQTLEVGGWATSPSYEIWFLKTQPPFLWKN